MEPMFNIFYPSGHFRPGTTEHAAFEDLLNGFAAHEQHERQFLDEYADIADRHDNPLMRFLLQLIIADEEKHQALVHSITEALRTNLVGPGSGEDLPTLGPISPEEKAALLKLTATFTDSEKEGIKQYKALKRPSRNLYGGLLVLLIDTIIHDSEKHLEILRFIGEKLRED